eukprot:scaffold126364_cov28-Tisochrysis_lutea.AAC.4
MLKFRIWVVLAVLVASDPSSPLLRAHSRPTSSRPPDPLPHAINHQAITPWHYSGEGVTELV